MDNDLQAALYKAYPDVFPTKNKNGVDHFTRLGFQVGTGWYKPLQELGRQLMAIGGVVVRRLAEDKGLLVLHFECATVKQARVQKIVDAVVETCSRLCEVCGAKAALIPAERRVMCRKCASLEGVDFEGEEEPLPPIPKLAARPKAVPHSVVEGQTPDLVDLMLGLPQEGDDD